MARDPFDEYTGDVQYEIWRSGGNPDRVHPDWLLDGYYSGASAEDFARRELRRQRPPGTPEEEFPEEREE